jgi:Resolvase, N terminal domain
MMVGYARVSTDGQTLDAQHAALKAAGADRIFAEKVSGAATDRRQLQRALATLASGDLLLVTRLDRLARSTRDLLNVLATISGKGAGFKFTPPLSGGGFFVGELNSGWRSLACSSPCSSRVTACYCVQLPCVPLPRPTPIGVARLHVPAPNSGIGLDS